MTAALVYADRQRQQLEDDVYRAAAARRSGGTVSPQASVNRPAHEDGAFVEVTVWVPREELTTPAPLNADVARAENAALRAVMTPAARAAADVLTSQALRVEWLEEELRALRVATVRYVEWHGPAHEVEDCPGDDTCECAGKPINDALNAALAAAEKALQQ